MFDKPELTMIKKGYEKHKRLTAQTENNEFIDKMKLRKENTRISRGDIVGLYKYRKDVHYLVGNPVLTGSVSKINDHKITIMCDGRSDVDVFTEAFEGEAYTVVQMVNDITFKRFNECLKSLEFYIHRSEFKVNELIRVLF